MTQQNDAAISAQSSRKPGESDPGSPAAALPLVKSAENAGTGEEVVLPAFSRRQLAALPVVAMCPSVSQAARVAGVGRTTLRRWLDDPDFRSEVARLRQEAANLARQELKGLMLRGAAVIGEAMDDPNPAIRLRAAGFALSYGSSLSDTEELAADLADLRHALALSSGQSRQG